MCWAKPNAAAVALLGLLAALAVLPPPAEAEWIARRRPQFSTEPGYVVTPLPYSLPGVGTGLGLIGSVNNIGGTTVDATGAVVGGDVEGTIGVVTDVPAFWRHVLLDFTRIDFNKGSNTVYRNRGMTSASDDYQVIELEDTSLQGGRAILTFDERRFELFAIRYYVQAATAAVRDPEGDLVATFEPPVESAFESTTTGLWLDYTDDRTDPRRGLRFVAQRNWSPRTDTDAAEYYVVDNNTTAYLPVFGSSTLALNRFQSDAYVTDRGLTDREAILADLRSQTACPLTAGCDDEALEALANNQLAANRHGTASSLGGLSRLRSYPGARFRGAHTLFYGAELRWNVTDEESPFDYVLAQDLRTNAQIAFFYETGTVAEQPSRLGNHWRVSRGVGARLVTASGFVYRLDVATGDEGTEVTVFFDYPWGTIGQ